MCEIYSRWRCRPGRRESPIEIRNRTWNLEDGTYSRQQQMIIVRKHSIATPPAPLGHRRDAHGPGQAHTQRTGARTTVVGTSTSLLRCGRSAERKATACRATCHTATSHLVVHVNLEAGSDCNHESRTRNGGSAQARGHQRERAPSWNLSGSFLVTFLDPVGSKAHFPTERLGRRRRKCLHQRRRRLRQVKHRIRRAASRPKLAFVVAVGVV